MLVALFMLVLATIALVNGWMLAGARSTAALDAPEVVIVLGNAVRDDGAPAPMLWDRLEEALAAYQSGRVSKILVSGDARYGESKSMRTWLEQRGVPPCALVVDEGAVDTYTSFWRAKHVFGVSRAIVVTQQFHMPRALWMARRMGMGVEGASADRRVDDKATVHETREVISRMKAFVDVVTERVPVGASLPALPATTTTPHAGGSV
jgi:SanA protein